MTSGSEGADWVRATYGEQTTDAEHDCDLTVLEVDSVTVTSGATQTNVTGAKNWAAVKDPTGNVMIEATLDPDIAESHVPAGLVTWTGGSAVEGHPLQRKVSKAASAHTTVTATCCTSSDYVDVWVVWATVENKMTGTTPANAVQFGSAYDGTENLGAQSYDSGTKAVGKVVPIGTITPAGVHDVVESGWAFERERWSHDFKDGIKSTVYWDTNWTNDTSAPQYQNLTPDSDDKIYDRDAPSIGIATITDSYETYNNFRQWLEWNGTTCSGYAYWYWKAWRKKDESPEITLKQVGSGNIELPGEDDAHYPPP